MEQATRKINEQHERIEELQFENAKLREELQQSEDRFRNIPDEVWSKADLVEMTNKVLEERDDAHKQIAALRADAERYRYIKNSETMEVSEILQTFCVSITFDLDAAIDAVRAKEAQP
jgi:predicted nuclease with TOPRIM domain